MESAETKLDRMGTSSFPKQRARVLTDENKAFDELVSCYKEAIEEIEEKLLKLEANTNSRKVKKCKYQNKGFCKCS